MCGGRGVRAGVCEFYFAGGVFVCCVRMEETAAAAVASTARAECLLQLQLA